jgi:hypothetical protein
MPIQHILLLKLKSGVTEDQIKQLIEETKILRRIPGVLEVTCGKNFTTRAPHEFAFTVVYLLVQFTCCAFILFIIIRSLNLSCNNLIVI